jgi:hypothetical protein
LCGVIVSPDVRAAAVNGSSYSTSGITATIMRPPEPSSPGLFSAPSHDALSPHRSSTDCR